jgi:NADH-quinone oxidoreductase subunit J
MTIQFILFILFSLVTLFAAVRVVTTSNLMHAALFLILSFFGVAGLYVLLDAGFFAAAQVMIYIGAISILFIFAAMLTRGVHMDPKNSQWQGALVISAIIFGILALALSPIRINIPEMRIGNLVMAPGGRQIGGAAWSFAPPTNTVSINEFGAELGDFNAYGILLLIAGVLLLIGMVGAIWVARERRPAEIIAERKAYAELDAAEKVAAEQKALPPASVAAHAEAHH